MGYLIALLKRKIEMCHIKNRINRNNHKKPLFMNLINTVDPVKVLYTHNACCCEKCNHKHVIKIEFWENTIYFLLPLLK